MQVIPSGMVRSTASFRMALSVISSGGAVSLSSGVSIEIVYSVQSEAINVFGARLSSRLAVSS